MYRGLLSGVDVCWSSLDTHALALRVAVSPPVPVRILPWSCHTPSGEDATSFLCAVWLLFPTKTEFFVWYFEFNAFFRHLKKSRDKFCTGPFLCACTYVYICSCSVCRVLSSFCPCYYSALLYSSCILCIPYSGANYNSIQFNLHSQANLCSLTSLYMQLISLRCRPSHACKVHLVLRLAIDMRIIHPFNSCCTT